MTCIIGLVDKDTVYIGADRASNTNNWTRPRATPKVFSISWFPDGRVRPSRHQFLIASSGDTRFGQIIQYQFEPPLQESGTEMHYLANAFIPALRACIRAQNAMGADEGRDEMNGAIMVGYRAELYVIFSDFSIGVYEGRMDSIGSGTQYALGAMSGLTKLSPQKRILKALEITAQFSSDVIPPFDVMKLRYDPREELEFHPNGKELIQE